MLLFTAYISSAQVPANNECSGAINVPVNTNLNCAITVAGTTISATPSSNTMSCLTTGFYPDVWFRFIATGNAHQISMPGFSGSVILTTYSGACGGLTQISCGFSGSYLMNTLVAGNTYYVRVTTLSPSNFNICVGTPPPPPVNDECIGAVTLPVNADLSCDSSVAGTGFSSTPSSDPMSCLPVGTYGDVWYSFTATAAQHYISYSSTTAGGSAFIVAYSGACGSLTELNCIEANTFLTGLTPGTTYRLRLITVPTENFNICIGTSPGTLTNDECAGAIEMNAGFPAPVIPGSATQSLPPASCNAGTSVKDLWYKFTTGNTAGNVTLTVSNPAFTAVVMEVFTGACGALTSTGCNSNSSSTVNYTVPVAANTTYYVRIYAPNSNTANFTIAAAGAPLPVTMDKLSGKLIAGKARLAWNTLSEQNNKGFEMLRSDDGKTFKAISWVPTQAINGTSSALLSYVFNDDEPITERGFYQIRQIDMDGHSSLSNIISLSAKDINASDFSFYPNPAKNQLSILVDGNNSEHGMIMITDLSGRVMIKQALAAKSSVINIAALPAGAYLIKYNNNNKTSIQKMIKH